MMCLLIQPCSLISGSCSSVPVFVVPLPSVPTSQLATRFASKIESKFLTAQIVKIGYKKVLELILLGFTIRPFRKWHVNFKFFISLSRFLYMYPRYSLSYRYSSLSKSQKKSRNTIFFKMTFFIHHQAANLLF